VQSDDIEAESIKAINIAAKTISAAQISARSITGDEIDVNTITVTNLNFTPVQTGNVVTSINASTEGIRIAGNRITIDGDVTFAASYDPSTKITTGGAAADVNANVTTISGGKITTGSITALQIQAGTITGDRISSATTITAGSDNSIAALNGSAGVVTDGTNDLIDENGALIRGNTWRIYAGNVDPNTAPFRVEADGTLFATNAVITTASAGIRMENDEIRFIEVAGGRFNRISFYESNNIVQIGEITATPAYVSGSTFFPQEIDIRSTYTLRLDAEDLWMTADNEVRLWSDNFIISAPVSIVTNNVSFSSGNGIDFSSNSGAIGMTSKVLVDYEEGNWTPTYTTTGTNFTSVTYAIRYGRYTKIGNMVTAWFVLSTSAMTIGSASGTVCVEGLPFTAANVLNASAAGSIARSVDFADDRPSAIAVQPNTKYANLYFRNTADGDTLVLAPADMATGFVANILEATISYCV
jgi:hypothetical protein